MLQVTIKAFVHLIESSSAIYARAVISYVQ